MLASAGDFVSSVMAYLHAGFTDFQIAWPRTDQQYETMCTVARDHIPELRLAFQSRI
jgi:hypothetical protein